MVWPMIIAAGAQIAGTAIKSAQARRAKSLRDDPRGQANAAFGANYGGAQRDAQRAAEDASMHQQLSLAKSGSGTLGSQASAIQMAGQRAPAAAAQAQLAAGRVAEGFAHGANEYMGTTMAGNSAGMDAQAGAENQMIDSMGMGAQMIAGAFGGGGQAPPAGPTQSDITRHSMPLNELPEVVPDVVDSDIRMKQHIQPLDGMPSREVRLPGGQRSGWNFSDEEFDRFSNETVAKAQRDVADRRHTGGLAGPGQLSPDASVHPSQMNDGDFITPRTISQQNIGVMKRTLGLGGNAPATNPATWTPGAQQLRSNLLQAEDRANLNMQVGPSTWTPRERWTAANPVIESDARSKQQIQALSSQNQQLLGELEATRVDQLRRLGALGGPPTQRPVAGGPPGNYVAQADFGGIQKPATSTPSWLSPDGGMRVTTQEEAALGSAQEMGPANGATRSFSYSVDQSGNRGSAFGPSGDREMQGVPSGLPAHNPVPQEQATNRPAGALRHQSPFGGVDLRGMAPEAQAQFQMQNPDFVNNGGIFTRQGAPGTSGMGGPPGGQSAPDQLYFDQSGQFSGEFAPWVQDRAAARDLSTGGALRDRPTSYNDQPNAYSNRIRSDAGGFQRGQGYAQAFDAPESYRQMVKDGKITGMVRVPILDFTNKVGLQSLPRNAQATPRYAPRPSDAVVDNSADPGLETLGAEKRLAADNAASGQANSDAVREELAFREEMRAKNAAASAAKPRAPGGAPALAGVPQVIAEEPFTPSPAQLARQKGRVVSEEPFKRAPQIEIGSAQMEPEPQVQIGSAVMEPSPLAGLDWKSGGASMASMASMASRSPAKAKAPAAPAAEPEPPQATAAQEKMRDFIINDFMKLNPGYYGAGDNERVKFEDLDEEKAKEVDAKVKELLSAPGAVASNKPVSDKRTKRSRGKVSAAEVFEQTPGYSYEYKPGTEGAKVRPGQRVGIMAQDLEKTPAGKTVVETGPDGKKRVDAAGLTLLNSAALSELQKRLKNMEARVG